jgi:hypothetical protein
MRTRAALLVAAAAAIAAPAHAQVDLISPEAFSALIDVRAGLATGERSWTDRGYGKSRWGGTMDGETRLHAEIAEAAIAWKPKLGWEWSGVFVAQYQPGQRHEVDLVEAYINYKPVPSSAVRFSGRAGLFWPHISQEHNDAFWGTSYTITPSAINSWVGEEVKVVGAEGTIQAPVAGHTLIGTAGVFGYNDTAGTILALRGWALHDLKTSAFDVWPLPRLNRQFARIWRGQDQVTEPTRHDLDDKAGFYGRLEWRPPTAPVSANLYYYDNRGDPTVVESGQWGWDTRFWNVGAAWEVDENTRVLSQVMWGQTIEGLPTPQGVWIDVGFTSAYMLATRSFGQDRLTARVEYFKTRDRTWQARDNNNERGWSATAAWRRDLTDRLRLFTEVLHIDSDRPARLYQSVARKQAQTVVQSSLRYVF